ncbi:PD-(D/E)XK nuclease superfamily protein [compost metagenome]
MKMLDDLDSFSGFLDEPAPTALMIPVVNLPEGATDPRLSRFSYSGLLDLHACPRLYQLLKMQAPKPEGEDIARTVTFAYGHAVGEGIQQYLIARTDPSIADPVSHTLWKVFLAWDADLLAENDKQKKSFLRAVAAILEFIHLSEQGFLAEDYEVAYFEGKPAAELSFRIDLGDGFYYRGYVDLVLIHKPTGQYLILELKTSSANYVNHYMYKNSAQAIGYSVVLDAIAPGISSYGVQYLVWMSKLQRFEAFDFPKTFRQRVQWIQDLIWDKKQVMDMVSFYGGKGIWPMRGESCTRFGSVCDYMDLCGQSTERLVSPLLETQLVETAEYQFNFTLEELLA